MLARIANAQTSHFSAKSAGEIYPQFFLVQGKLEGKSLAAYIFSFAAAQEPHVLLLFLGLVYVVVLYL